MNKYWFRPKRLGYGFMPISLEGWLATCGLLILIFLSAHINNIYTDNATAKEGLRFLLDTLLIAGLFTALYKDKVDGGLRWRFWK